MRTNLYTPKKSLGQHFLHDMNIARNIVAQLDAQPDDTVLEIGPGQGVLTGLLYDTGCSLIAADIDQRAIEALSDIFPAEAYPRLLPLHANVLTMDLRELSAEHKAPLRVIGNLPYNITSQIFFHIFDQPEAVRDAVFMMQREVAERIIAKPHCKEYGILSVLTQTHAAVRRCFNVSPNVFTPKPNVWSSVIHVQIEHDRLAKIKNYSFFRRLVKATFGQRRKTLSNSLKQLGFTRESLPSDAVPFLSQRPEQLAVGDFIMLSNLIEDHVGTRKE
ncbi:MAG: 16S rRNA (adenine(1518)-N(6)/adenine(1519)-N(6))-dimethyltransferase RsmA [Bacteroidota bacterium]